MAETEDYNKSATPTAHKTTHQGGGTDEISVTGLSGLLADGQTPLAHKTSHQDTGTDEISVEGLAGELAAEQKSAWTKVSGKPTTFDPAAHKTSHQDAGADEISVTGLSGTLADDQHILDAEAQAIKLDDFAAPDDNTDLDVSTSKHGLCPKAPNDTTKFFRGDATYAVPTGQVSIANLQGYINGLQLSNNSGDANHDIDIATGFAVDSTNTYAMTLASILTKRLDASWAAGTNQGGIDTGSMTASTWYHVYLIRKDSDGTIDALFTATYGSPTMPSGWTAKRRLGSVLTNSSNRILGFTQDRDTFWWWGPPLDVDDADLDTTGETYTLASIPPGPRVLAKLHASLYISGATPLVYIVNPDLALLAPSVTVGPLSTLRQTNSGAREHHQIEILTNTSAQIAAIPSANNCEFKIATLGWVDPRI